MAEKEAVLRMTAIYGWRILTILMKPHAHSTYFPPPVNRMTRDITTSISS